MHKQSFHNRKVEQLRALKCMMWIKKSLHIIILGPLCKGRPVLAPVACTLHLILQTTNTLVKVKKENFQAESQLANALEDLEDTQETLGQQVVFTDSWQGRFDELAILAEAAGVDKVQVCNIRNRSFVAGTKCAQNYE